MRPLSGSPRTLQWRGTSWLVYREELREGEDVVATLRWPFMSFKARGESTAGAWNFSVTHWRRRTTVRDARTSEVVLVFQPDVFLVEGTLEFASGARFLWRRWGKPVSEMQVQTVEGERLLTFRPRGFLIRRNVTVTLEDRAQRLPERTLLLLTVRYLLWVTTLRRI